MYIIIHSAIGYFEEKNGEKYLILDLIEKYKEVFSRIKSEIKTITGGEKLFMKSIKQKLELTLMIMYH